MLQQSSLAQRVGEVTVPRECVSACELRFHSRAQVLPFPPHRHFEAPRAPHGLLAARPERLRRHGRGTNSKRGTETAAGQPHVSVTAAPPASHELRREPATETQLGRHTGTERHRSATEARFDLETQAAASPAACAQEAGEGTTAGPAGPRPPSSPSSCCE